MTLGAALLGFASIAGLLTLIPGLDTALILKAALGGDRRAACWTAGGISAGVLVWGIAAAGGIAALLAVSRLAYDLVRLCGAGYLLYLGVKLVLRGWGAGRRDEIHRELATTPRRAFGRGLLTNLLNPKVGVFYLATLPQFLVPGVPALLLGALLAAVHVLIGLLWFGALIATASAASRWLLRPKVGRVLDAVTGAVLIAFGVRTALEVR